MLAVDPTSMERHRIIAGNKEDSRTASFDMLRTQVLQQMKSKGYRTLAVTSPTPQCGKTTVAINLAMSIAQLTESEVLLGDLDFRRPRIVHYFGIRPYQDLSSYILGGASLEEVLVDPGIPRLLLLPNMKSHRNAAEMLTSRRMKGLVEMLKISDTNRVCILDLPPMLSTDDVIAFLPQVDSVLLIVADGVSKKPELEETLRLLGSAPLLGVVLNKSAERLRAYY
jgi:Mrp family chromosome partitioning ATPase